MARHLFRRAVTLLSQIMNASSESSEPRAELREAEFRKWVNRFVGNAWSPLVRLVESGDVKCPTGAVECYEQCYGYGAEEYLRRYSGMSTSGDLLRGYGPVWRWAPFTPRRVEICGREKYCMLLTAIKSEIEHTICGLVVSFDSFVRIFEDARGQLDSG